MELLKPKFSFLLILKKELPMNYKYKSVSEISENSLLCFAEGYEIKDDGLITFYQTVKKSNDGLVKVPVFSLTKEYWDSCILYGNGDCPIFEGEGALFNVQNSQPRQERVEDVKSNANVEDTSQSDLFNELGFSNAELGVSNQQNNNENNQPEVEVPEPSEPEPPKEENKKEVLEKLIRAFTKEKSIIFDMDRFLTFAKQEHFLVSTEKEVSGIIVNMLKGMSIHPGRFLNKDKYKLLDLYLPKIMKLHWQGNMAPILLFLNDKEETKDINSVDLAVWLAANGYF